MSISPTHSIRYALHCQIFAEKIEHTFFEFFVKCKIEDVFKEEVCYDNS